MNRGSFIVEQVGTDGLTVNDYDQSLSPTEIKNVLEKFFGEIKKENNLLTFCYGSHVFAVKAKNVTYLGNPHPAYKKRIQISDDLQTFYNNAKTNEYIPLLLGVYSYKNNFVICDFNIDDYINKKSHNSSAHVYVSDLQEATLCGYFQKTDYFKNTITVFKSHYANVFLEEKISNKKDIELVLDQLIVKDNSEYESNLESAVSTINNFFVGIDKKWNGISCYKEMIGNNYSNRFQPEWAGFYLEFLFEKYINANNAEDIVKFTHDKTKDGKDLDLFFNQLNAFGDLKAHSANSRGIQGNDWETVFDILQGNEFSRHIYYVVCQHLTNKDSDFNYEVTKYWNTVQNKKDLLSYSKRMKHDVELTSAHILDINPKNSKYLSVFRQGVNSDGKPRNPKIMIETDNLKNFELKRLVF